MKTNNAAKTNAHFTINFFDKTISGTKTSFSKAGKGVSPYYQELTEKMNAHPDYKLIVKEPKKKSNKAKRTYEGMDFAFMEAYIALQKNKDVLLNEYKSVREYAKKANLGIYPTTKKWFLNEFDPDGKGFNMKKAQEEIKQAGLDDAILNAPAAA